MTPYRRIASDFKTGREFTTYDIVNRTGLEMGKVKLMLSGLVSHGVIQSYNISDTRVYRLAKLADG